MVTVTPQLHARLRRAHGQLSKILDDLERALPSSKDEDNSDDLEPGESIDALQLATQLKAAAHALMKAKDDFVQEQIVNRLHEGIGNNPNMPQSVQRDLLAYSGLL